MSQLRGTDFGVAIFVNSYIPVSGQTRYLDGLPVLGCGRETIRASGVALEDKMNILEGRPVFREIAYLALDAGSSTASAVAVLVDRVFVISDVLPCECVEKLDESGPGQIFRCSTDEEDFAVTVILSRE